ncbi:steroid receptor RNA activator 1 isoform X2 [Eupeodes corollae]|uniref:steroid receptor RNA activator 1 isoform X2 n=1 Tax=Eupeodes corollae TaxID=290404 RepID=UPI002491226D|nr:steroid receptor RNA activator 1 isoform X2 [Eupeodes corollae]
MSDKAPPTSSGPGTHTPGWNDPPKLQFNALPASGKTKLNLNKRIAFPLQGGPTTSKPTAIVQPNQTSAPLPLAMPPLVGASNSQHPVAVVHPMPNVNAPPPSQPPTAAAQTSPLQPPTAPFQEPVPDDAQQFALGILRLQLIKVQESPNVRLDEIQRRVGVMEQLWQSGNLTMPVQAKIYKIAKAVETNSMAEAMETYTSLVLSHSNECSTWAVALRHIILTLQPNNARPLPTVDEYQITASASNSSSPQAATNCVLVPAMPRITNPNDRGNPVQHI